MTRLLVFGCPLLLASLFSVGCGSDDAPEKSTIPSPNDSADASSDAAPAVDASPGVDASPSTSGSLPCQEVSGDSCDPTTSYCIQAVSGSVVESGLCAPLPADCESCDCFEQDAPTAWTKAYPGTSNCSGTLECNGSSSGVTITCE